MFMIYHTELKIDKNSGGLSSKVTEGVTYVSVNLIFLNSFSYGGRSKHVQQGLISLYCWPFKSAFNTK